MKKDIKYFLIDNPITPDPNDCRGQLINNQPADEDDLIERIISKGSPITKAEAMSNIEELQEAIVFFMLSGRGIRTSFINIVPVLKGVFTDSKDGFDPARHRIVFSVTLGPRLKEVIAKVTPTKVDPPKNEPTIAEFTDHFTDSINQLLTPGSGAEITGSKLKFDENDPAQGIFFIDKNGKETRIAKTIRNKPSNLIFNVPKDLTAGEYIMELRNQVGNVNVLKKTRLKQTLTV